MGSGRDHPRGEVEGTGHLSWKKSWSVPSRIVPTSGIAAFLHALEVVRNLCGMEPTLKGKILAVDLASFRFDLIELSPVV